MLDNLTVKEKWILAGVGAALIWGLIGGALQVRQSFIRSATPRPDLYRELFQALPDPEYIGLRSLSSFPGSDLDSGLVYMTRPLLPGDREIEDMEDGWIFFPRHYYTTININEADAEELATLPGIGPASARRILDYRDQYVGFIKMKAIKNVDGIGDKTLRRMEGRVRLY
ncbi:MAG: ComEA family DNA-binding protein [Candidatus Auribacterota bacterium]|nr:ComEA family DNA-binding protein [Candidatus Auribacterota bacterium]